MGAVIHREEFQFLEIAWRQGYLNTSKTFENRRGHGKPFHTSAAALQDNALEFARAMEAEKLRREWLVSS